MTYFITHLNLDCVLLDYKTTKHKIYKMSIASENKAVLFVRHAEVDKDNDHTLSEVGIQQAITTADYIVEKLTEKSYDVVKIFSSPEHISMESVVPLAKLMKDSGISYNFRIVPNCYEYRRVNKEDIKTEFNGRKYSLKADKTWQHFIKRVDTVKKYLERELKAGEKQLVIFYGHPVFFSSFFTNLVSQGDSYPKHYGQVSIHLPNCSISATGFDNSTGKWDLFSLANTNHLGQDKTGTHVNF